MLKGEVPVGQRVTVQGWVRSKRDSKAGISFIAVHDGSSFDAIQAVVPNDLDNYESEIMAITTGSAVCISGELVTSQGKGQSVEIQATEVQVIGLVDDPETYTAPWTVAFPYKRDNRYTQYEYACHEGNYAMESRLSGARVQEQDRLN